MNNSEYENFDRLLSAVQEGIGKVQKEFDAYQREKFALKTPEFFCLELNGEAGELANVEKKHWKGDHIEAERFEDEAADVMIALFNYSNARGINLAEAVNCKLKKIDSKRLVLEKQGKKY